MNRPTRVFGLLGLAMAGAAGFAAWRIGLEPLWAYLLAVSVATFVLFGLDKGRARRSRGRIPEAVLHLAAAIGGSAGALAGMLVFRHKTRKTRFQAVFWLIVAAQIAAIALYLHLYAR